MKDTLHEQVIEIIDRDFPDNLWLYTPTSQGRYSKWIKKLKDKGCINPEHAAKIITRAFKLYNYDRVQEGEDFYMFELDLGWVKKTKTVKTKNVKHK